MATTTNFGWETPDDTDLVKDGAAAMRTLGNSIDTSFVDLKGGTTGQVLAKASGTDLDFSWVAQDDSNAIQNAIVDAKGDLIAATAADTPARLAVGTNGQVLTADSTAATGIKWATAAAGGITQLATGTLSGSTVSISSISGSYKSLQLLVFNITSANDYGFRIALNTITSNYQLNGFSSSLFSGSGSLWGFNPASNFKSNNAANYFQMNLPNYASSSPTAFVGDSVFSFLLSDGSTRFSGQATMVNTSVSAAITRIDIISGDTFNGGTYILNGIS